jgi:hypothetical protein
MLFQDYIEEPGFEVRVVEDFMDELTDLQRKFVQFLCIQHHTFIDLPSQEDVKFFLNSYEYVRLNAGPYMTVSAYEFSSEVLRLYNTDIERFKRQYGYWN